MVIRVDLEEGRRRLQKTREGSSSLDTKYQPSYGILDEDRRVDGTRERVWKVCLHRIAQFPGPCPPQISDWEVQFDLRCLDHKQGFEEEEGRARVPSEFPHQARRPSLWEDAGKTGGLVGSEESDGEAVSVDLRLKFLSHFGMSFLNFFRGDNDHLAEVWATRFGYEGGISAHDLLCAAGGGG